MDQSIGHRMGQITEQMNERAECGLIRRRSYRYILPLLMGMVFSQSSPAVDAICVSGALGEEALSALITVMPMGYLISALGAMGGLGTGVYISKCSGSGERARAARVFTRAIIYMTIITAVMALLIGIFHEQALTLCCATPENRAFAREYLLTTLVGSPMMTISFAADYLLFNDNNPNLCMIGTIVGAAVNIVVDYVGLYVLHGGIWIAAMGTVLGALCTCLVCLLHFRKKDRLCRFTSPRRREGDPNLLEIIKPGAAEGVMYVLFAVQLLIQNYVLRNSAGTSGLGNSSIIENLQLFITIVIAGITDTTYPVVSAYYGEQNKSGILLAKRVLVRIGYILLIPVVLLLCICPEIMIRLYSIDDAFMLQTLPWSIRVVSVTALLSFISSLLIDFLSSTEKEGKATVAMIIQLTASCLLALALEKQCSVDAPWYADLIANVLVLVYLIIFGEKAFKGALRFYPENLRILCGGKLTGQNLREWEAAASGILTERERQIVSEEMMEPLLAALPDGPARESTFTILDREDGRKAVILRYEGNKDILAHSDKPVMKQEETEEETILLNQCMRSEFFGARRVMLVLDCADAAQ